jgi:hypothetical protein
MNDKPDQPNAEAPKPMQITFTSAVFKGDDAKKARTPEFQQEHGVFGIHELNVGGEDFVAVFGRTTTTLK